MMTNWPPIDPTVIKFFNSLGQVLIQHQALREENAALQDQVTVLKQMLEKKKRRSPAKRRRK